MKIFIAAISGFLMFTSLVAQPKQWTLEDCIDYSMENNISIKRQELSIDSQERQLKQDKLNRLPDLSAGINGGYSFGLTWIQQEGTNIEVSNSYLSPSIGTNMPIYQGSAIRNTIKKSKYDLMASVEASEKTKNDITIQITAAFLQIVFDKELLKISEQQYDLSLQQIEQTVQLVDAGRLTKSDLLDVKSQAATDELNLTQQKNNLSISILNLAQLLDLENEKSFDIYMPDSLTVNPLAPSQASDIYNTALGIMPEVKQAEYQVKGSEYSVKISKGSLYPTIGLGAGIDSRATWLLDDDSNINRSFGDQLQSNRNTYIGAQLSIPIYGRSQARTNVTNAKISLMDAQYNLEQTKLTLMKEIQQAHTDATAAYYKYLSSKKAVDAYSESFYYVTERFNQGMISTVDFNTAKNDYARAQSNLLQSKVEYILRTKILDFYTGNKIDNKM